MLSSEMTVDESMSPNIRGRPFSMKLTHKATAYSLPLRRAGGSTPQSQVKGVLKPPVPVRRGSSIWSLVIEPDCKSILQLAVEDNVRSQT